MRSLWSLTCFPTAEQRRRAGDRLDELVRESGYHIRTGFVGTPLICDALCDTGHYATVYRLLMQRETPSWLYPVTMGATTIWERWDSMLPDGSINPGEMTSFNHYAFGAVADWIHRTIGGLTPTEPGYRRMQIHPRPGGGITHAHAKHITPYGPVECKWEIEDGKFDLNVIVPPNTIALVCLPNGEQIEIGSGERSWSVSYQNPDKRDVYTVDDLVGDILSNHTARTAVLNTLERANTPDFLRGMIFNGNGLPLRQALIMFPNYDQTVKLMNDALANAL
jgi:alpha-L-rhamnosidase